MDIGTLFTSKYCSYIFGSYQTQGWEKIPHLDVYLEMYKIHYCNGGLEKKISLSDEEES